MKIQFRSARVRSPGVPEMPDEVRLEDQLPGRVLHAQAAGYPVYRLGGQVRHWYAIGCIAVSALLP
jgi:hypothetical protein